MQAIKCVSILHLADCYLLVLLVVFKILFFYTGGIQGHIIYTMNNSEGLKQSARSLTG